MVLMRPISLKRYFIILGDLDWAAKFADQILSGDFHNRTGEHTDLIHRALNLSMVVSYWRPFGKSREAENEPSTGSPLYPIAETVLSSDEYKLHKKLHNARNNVYAHSAADLQFSYEPDEEFAVIKNDVLIPFSAATTLQVKELIGTWLRFLQSSEFEDKGVLKTER